MFSYGYMHLYACTYMHIQVMEKPAHIFDGRLILDHKALQKIGFKVFAVGKSLGSHVDMDQF